MTFTELDRAVSNALPANSSCCCTVTTWHHGCDPADGNDRTDLRFRVTAFAPNVTDECHQTKEHATADEALAEFRVNILPVILRAAGLEVGRASWRGRG